MARYCGNDIIGYDAIDESMWATVWREAEYIEAGGEGDARGELCDCMRWRGHDTVFTYRPPEDWDGLAPSAMSQEEEAAMWFGWLVRVESVRYADEEAE